MARSSAPKNIAHSAVMKEEVFLSVTAIFIAFIVMIAEGKLYDIGIGGDESLFQPDREPTMTMRDARAEYANRTKDLCWFGPEYESLFNHTKVAACGGDLSSGVRDLSRMLFDAPKNPYLFYTRMNITYCPSWIAGSRCLRNVLKTLCSDMQLYKMKMDKLINFIIPINEVFCSVGAGNAAIFEFLRSGGSECMADDGKFQKPMEDCLKQNKFTDIDAIALYFATYQKCAAPLLQKCEKKQGRDPKFSVHLRKFFEDLYIRGRKFWKDLDV